MIYASLVNHDAISSINATAYAEAQNGSNGDFWGGPELNVGGSATVSTGRVAWDDYLDDGLDTGWINESVTYHAGSSASISLNSDATSSAMTESVGTSGCVEKVQLRAMTQVAGFVELTNLTVTFSKNDVVTDSYTATESAVVDTTSHTSAFSSESILEVLSDRTDNDAVTVAGKFRLLSPEGVYLGLGDLAVQVYVFCADAI